MMIRPAGSVRWRILEPPQPPAYPRGDPALQDGPRNEQVRGETKLPVEPVGRGKCLPFEETAGQVVGLRAGAQRGLENRRHQETAVPGLRPARGVRVRTGEGQVVEV